MLVKTPALTRLYNRHPGVIHAPHSSLRSSHIRGQPPWPYLSLPILYCKLSPRPRSRRGHPPLPSHWSNQTASRGPLEPPATTLPGFLQNRNLELKPCPFEPFDLTAVYAVGVKLPAHSYEVPYSKKLWGYPYVEYPIANTYEVDPMADSHSYQSSVWSWSEPYGTQLRSNPQQKAMGLSVCRVPHCKHL